MWQGIKEGGLLFLMPPALRPVIQRKPGLILHHFPAQKEVLVPLGPDHEGTVLVSPKYLFYDPQHTKTKGGGRSEGSGLYSVEVKSLVPVKH